MTKTAVHRIFDYVSNFRFHPLVLLFAVRSMLRITRAPVSRFKFCDESIRILLRTVESDRPVIAAAPCTCFTGNVVNRRSAIRVS
jgi:hypothetical protein